MARDFDGVDDVINCGSGSQLDDLAAWTHCAWFYADTVGEAGFGTMCRKNANDAGLGKVMHIQATAAVRAACRRATTNQQLVSANNTYPLNQWNFVAYTYDGTTGRLYVATPGGVVSEVTYATNTQGVGAITADGNTNLTIGNDSTGATTFDGRLAYVRWFNAALSLDELTAVMYNRPVRPSALVGFWPLVGASPEPDWSGYLANGTVTGALVADGPPVPPPYICDEDFIAWATAGGPTLVSASDTLAPGITDAVSTIAASLAVSDTVAPGVTDAVSNILATLSAADTLAPSVSDAAAVLAAFSASDTLAPGVNDASSIAVVISASDTLAPGITDAVSTIAASLAVSDTVAPGVTDAVSNILATLAASDTLTVQVVDTSALLAAFSASDTLAPGVTDASSIAVVISASDTLAPGITDAVGAIAASLAVSDTLAPGITDAVSNILATLAASDTLTVQVVDAANLLAALSASDTLAPGVTDTTVVTIIGSTLGRMVAIISVRPALAGDVSADAALGATPGVITAIGGKPTVH